MIKQLSDHLVEKGIKLTYTKEALDLIAAESYSEKYGARNMRRYIQREIEDPLAEEMIAGHKLAVTQVSLRTENGKIVVNCL